MKINSKSAWSQQEIFKYLDNASTPIRIACTDSDGYPVICSLWFVHKDGVLWSASHKNSHLIKTLSQNPKIGFEVATNHYPYYGIRGKANISLFKDSSELVLDKVIDKYLQGSNAKLSQWLKSRQDDEYAIKIEPTTLNSWDFADRMAKD